MRYMTKEERKQKYEDYQEGFTFETNNDLSIPIVVTGDMRQTKRLARAITCFIGMWMHWNRKRLNGFSGLDCVNYEFVDTSKE